MPGSWKPKTLIDDWATIVFEARVGWTRFKYWLVGKNDWDR